MAATTNPDYPGSGELTRSQSSRKHRSFQQLECAFSLLLNPAGNVVEYIARHDLDNTVQGLFQSEDILYASEIGMIVDDVPSVADKLKEVVGIQQYRNGSSEFTAVGDEFGLLLVMKRGRKLSLAYPTKKLADVYPMVVSVRGVETGKYHFPEFPYEVFIQS